MIPLSLISKDNFNEILPGGDGEPEWISNNRNKAISQFSKLPFEVSPLYSKYTGLTMLEPEKIFFSNTESSALSNDLKIRLDEIRSAPSLIIVGSSVAHIHVPEQLSKQGLIISSIGEAFSKHPELLRKHFEDNANNYGEDRFLSLGLSSFQSGFFIYIPKNLVVPEPIRIVYSLRDDGTSSICRNVVISDVGSKATVVQELYSSTSSSTDISDEQARKPDKSKTQQCYFEVLECK